MGSIVTKALVESILRNPLNFEWTLQGLGMLRMYLDDDHVHRLHVWTTDHASEIGASEMHTHPWNFTSLVIAGRVHNTRYKFDWDTKDGQDRILDPAFPGPPSEWLQQKIKCGEGGCLVDSPKRVALREQPFETYRAGEIYKQEAEEIHKSNPEDGTVTIISREFGEDVEHAYVYFPVGSEWISAEPRSATANEIQKICDNALEMWFH